MLILPFAAIGGIAWRLTPRSPPPEVGATPGTSRGVDDFGDPLPPFAVRRFGSTRLRVATNQLALSPDGAKLYSGHDDGLVRVWDVA